MRRNHQNLFNTAKGTSEQHHHALLRIKKKLEKYMKALLNDFRPIVPFQNIASETVTL